MVDERLVEGGAGFQPGATSQGIVALETLGWSR
jgi:hypothetical protein